MSLTKRYFERQQEEEWSTVGDKFVCAKCFADYAIQKFISETAVSNECSYCDRKKKKPIAAEMDEVLSFISKGIHREYEDPIHSVGSDNESESGYAISPQSSYDLLAELGFGEGPDGLFQDLIHAFQDYQWVQRDPYGMLECDSWRYSWEEFCNQIKHKVRFVFFKVSTRRDSVYEPEPYTILESLGELVTKLGMTKPLPKATTLFRARQHDGTKTITKVKDIGTPPADSASQSRMSPAGIPMFYGAEDPATVIAEVVNPKGDPLVTIGTFETLRDMQLLDLTQLAEVPSLFDEIRYDERMPLTFMHGFVGDAVQPVVHDGTEHIEYVPTQVVAEFFRHVFRLPGDLKLDGVMFRSSKPKAGICYTIFCERENCCELPLPTGFAASVHPPLLLLKGVTTQPI